MFHKFTETATKPGEKTPANVSKTNETNNKRRRITRQMFLLVVLRAGLRTIQKSTISLMVFAHGIRMLFSIVAHGLAKCLGGGGIVAYAVAAIMRDFAVLCGLLCRNDDYTILRV